MHKSRWDPAYSFMAGVALPLDEASRLTAMYRGDIGYEMEL
jgi:hypothetical protein